MLTGVVRGKGVTQLTKGKVSARAEMVGSRGQQNVATKGQSGHTGGKNGLAYRTRENQTGEGQKVTNISEPGVMKRKGGYGVKPFGKEGC